MASSGGGGRGSRSAGGFAVKKLRPEKILQGEGKDAEKLRFSNGDEFEGPAQFMRTEFEPTGSGSYWVKAARALYTGTFEEGKLRGMGICKLENGDVIEGVWEEGVCEGRRLYKSGDVFTGTIRSFLRDVKGDHDYVDGTRYEGGWRKDVRYGEGRIVFPNGDHLEGTWKDGECEQASGRVTTEAYEFTGDVRVKMRRNTTAEDQQEDMGAGGGLLKEVDFEFFFNEQGTCQYVNGDEYEGSWRESQPHGQGRMAYADGSFFVGSWIHGKPQRGRGGAVLWGMTPLCRVG